MCNVSDRIIFCKRKCLQATSQKHTLSHAISFTVNYCLFTHSDVSYSFNGENDNVLELHINCTQIVRVSFLSYVNNKGAEQPEQHLCSLISCCLFRFYVTYAKSVWIKFLDSQNLAVRHK